eukprot:gene16674-biopygen4629
MTPESCQPGIDFFTGMVIAKQVRAGGIGGGDRITMRWNDPCDGGPPAGYFIPKERAERRFWWDGDGRPFRAAEIPISRKRIMSESLRDVVRELNLQEYEDTLSNSGFLTTQDVRRVQSPSQLPIQIPGRARRDLLDHTTKLGQLAADRAVQQEREPEQVQSVPDGVTLNVGPLGVPHPSRTDEVSVTSALAAEGGGAAPNRAARGAGAAQPSLAHLATPIEELSDMQKRSLAILENSSKRRASRCSNATKRFAEQSSPPTSPRRGRPTGQR